MGNLLMIKLEVPQMKKNVKKAIKELCIRTKDIRNGEYKKKTNKTKKGD